MTEEQLEEMALDIYTNLDLGIMTNLDKIRYIERVVRAIYLQGHTEALQFAALALRGKDGREEL